jgi:hypothetical protein
MFVYCNNCPVLLVDHNGTSPLLFVAHKTPKHTGLTKPIKQFISNLLADITALDKQNTSEQKVLEANYISMYKGKTVIKLPMGDAAFSFGILFIGDGVSGGLDPVNVVKHEYGHSVHMDLIGPIAYTIDVAIPSLKGFWFGCDEYDNYYSQPYEYLADYFGQVTNRITISGEPYPYQKGVASYSRDYFYSTFIRRYNIFRAIATPKSRNPIIPNYYK